MIDYLLGVLAYFILSAVITVVVTLVVFRAEIREAIEQLEKEKNENN